MCVYDAPHFEHCNDGVRILVLPGSPYMPTTSKLECLEENRKSLKGDGRCDDANRYQDIEPQHAHDKHDGGFYTRDHAAASVCVGTRTSVA